MTRAPIFVLALGTLLAGVLQVPVAARAQDEAREEPPAEAGQEGAAEERATPEDLEDIDQLLEGEEEILAGEGFSYDAGGRRDPFKSLLAPSKAPDLRGPRPEGIPGLLIDEVIITGIFRTQEGYVAQVQSAESEKSYLLKQGDELYDGDVVRITDNEIVFKQIVQDPTALKPFREVVKTLNPDQG
ncbi:MAG TPA: hypothetical protein VF150_10045 [Thermoanaerobaculia bacterium]